MKDIVRNGNEGIGKPEPLKHDFAGDWSRRITDEHRLVTNSPQQSFALRPAAITTDVRQAWSTYLKISTT